MTPTRARIETLVIRIQAAFLADPGLSMTLVAAQRRFGIDEATGAGVLGALVEARVLTEHHGVYRRNFPRSDERQAA